MSRRTITAIRFRPPVAVARLGDSHSPLEAFTWTEDTRLFASGKTILNPVVSLEVLEDGSVDPYMPGPIRFRDGLAIRPVCPFLELETEVAGKWGPLTSDLLEEAGMATSELYFRVVVANLKAARQTGDPTCSFEARLDVRGNDHRRHPLLAWTHCEGGQPLVRREQPIWLGAFQVIRPVRRKNRFGVSLDTIRVRFTPGHGAVYGPPFAIEGQPNGARARHMIVPPGNRILNPQASWCTFNVTKRPTAFTLPTDVYDGTDDLDRNGTGWGVVDDTCDAVVSASFSYSFNMSDDTPERPLANARVLVAPPHYSPDRRHIYSIADDVADRNPDTLLLGSSAKKQGREPKPKERLEALVDLFHRISELASQINLERTRESDLAENEHNKIHNPKPFPASGEADSMTENDRINDDHPVISDRFRLLASGDAGDAPNQAPLQAKSEYARMRHAELAVPAVFLKFILEQPDRFRELLRPPFRRLSDPPAGAQHKPEDFRDPHWIGSYVYDARMPPFIRDCDFAPLSLTRFQWDLLFDGTGALRKDQLQRAYEALKNR
jgi:hypothetical protein